MTQSPQITTTAIWQRTWPPCQLPPLFQPRFSPINRIHLYSPAVPVHLRVSVFTIALSAAQQRFLSPTPPPPRPRAPAAAAAASRKELMIRGVTARGPETSLQTRPAVSTGWSHGGLMRRSWSVCARLRSGTHTHVPPAAMNGAEIRSWAGGDSRNGRTACAHG